MPREDIVSGDEENIVGAMFNMLQRGGGGFNPRAMGGRAGGGFRGAVSQPQFSGSQLSNQVGGTQAGRLRAPLGMGTFVFVEGAPTSHSFVVEPQEAFRGERLIVDVGADAATAGVLATVRHIFVGSLPQQPSVEFGTPASMFRPDATDAQMDWQICPAGTKIEVEIEISAALGEGETATVAVGLYGVWIRG